MKKHTKAILFSMAGMLLFSGAYAAEYAIEVQTGAGAKQNFKQGDRISTRPMIVDQRFKLECTSEKSIVLTPIQVFQIKGENGEKQVGYNKVHVQKGKSESIEFKPSLGKDQSLLHSYVNFTVEEVDNKDNVPFELKCIKKSLP